MAERDGFDPGALFEPVVGTRMSMSIVRQVRSRIRSGELPVGSRLPAERELCRQFGVSRLTVREALRMLEATGLVTIKLGKEGGAFVSSPTARFVGQGITDLLSTAGLDSADVTEVRVVVELGLLPFACRRATPEDIARLREHCDRDEQSRRDGSYTVETSFQFHLLLAGCTQNVAAVMLLDAFSEPIIRALDEAHHGGLSGVNEHRRIIEAVADRDEERARQLLAQHLERTVSRVQP